MSEVRITRLPIECVRAEGESTKINGYASVFNQKSVGKRQK